MTVPLDFNPHEAPPQALKDVFKLWKGQLTPERDRHINENAVNMPRLDGILHHRLAAIFNRFSESDDANKPDITEQVALASSSSVYSSRNVPGEKTCEHVFRQRRGCRAVVVLFSLGSDSVQVF
jgi:alkylated DNA repair protein alkB homolog 1